MEMKETTFDWTLRYDEMDYIIEGTLDILIDGEKITGNAGDMIYIPKDSKIQFSAPKYAKFFYVTYPANWAEQ
jgi:ethanolamine utilization protein EutQ